MSAGTWFFKSFDDLSINELYSMLKLRSAIFVIDQQSLFADIDGRDNACYHLLYVLDGQVVAYTRILGPGQVYPEPCLSRVCTSLDQRGKGLGRELLKRALDEMSRLFPGQPIRISAQYYLKAFYESYGFEIAGDIYLDDGIEHVEMLKKASELSTQ